MVKLLSQLLKIIIFGFAFFGSGLLVFLAARAWTSSTDIQVTTGDTLTADKWNDTVDYLKMPIWTIVAWHKDFPNTPSLPAWWMECNWQVVNDTNSVYNWQTLPDLNSQVYAGWKWRYLRWWVTTWLFNESTNYWSNWARYAWSSWTRYWGLYWMYFNWEQWDALSYAASPSNYMAPHIQVTAMTVKWIIKVK